MEHTKKMFLIEPETIEKLKRPITYNNPMTSLDQDMENILKSKVNDEEKWKLYQQTLQRYLHFIKQGRQPIPIGIPHTSNNDQEDVSQPKNNEHYEYESEKENKITKYEKEEILNIIPKTYRNKADAVINKLKSHSDRISWNDQGVVSIDGETLSGSNITDLIGDILRPLKRKQPTGSDKFLHFLYDINLPMECVGNPDRCLYLHKLYIEKYKKDVKSTPKVDYSIPRKYTELSQRLKKEAHDRIKDSSTPLSSEENKNFGAKKKIKWQKWTP